MRDKFSTQEILQAVQVLLKSKIKKKSEIKKKIKKNDIPLDTEKIILQAEKYIKE